MWMSKNKIKIINFILFILIFILFFVYSSNIFPVFANTTPTNTCDINCLRQKLGLVDQQGNNTVQDTFGLLEPRDPNDFIILVFQILIYAALIIAVGSIVFAGYKIAGAGDNAEERKKGFDRLIWSIVGFVLAILALTIINLISSFFGYQFDGNITEQLCKNLQNYPNPDQKLIDECNRRYPGSVSAPNTNTRGGRGGIPTMQPT